MIDIALVLVASAFVFAVAAAAFLGWTRSLPSPCRRYGYAVTAAAGVMALSYAAMTAVELSTAAETDPIRFAGYTGLWIAIVYVVGAVAGVGRRLTLALLAVVLARVWLTFAGWLFDGIVGTLATLAPFVLLLVGIYLLFGPFTRVARSGSADRLLLSSKLKYLLVLGWIGLVASGLLSADALGLTDDFVGQISVIYVEAILVVGFGGIVLRGVDALEDAARSDGSVSFDAGAAD